MAILEAITQIDAEFTADPQAVIDVTGTTPDGRRVDLWIVNDGTGPVIIPGASFLPYGGIWYNPLIVSVEETA